MSYSYVVGTAIGTVRLLTPDNQLDGHIFEDEEIAAFLSLEGGSVRRAAALALETIAADQALVLKAIRLLDVQTDGPKVADSLLKRAATLRQQAEVDDAVAGSGAFDIAEMVFDSFGARERWINVGLRGGI